MSGTPQKRASPLEASPRGASLLTPEPAQKRRTMRGGDGGGSHSSGLHVSVPPETDQENVDVGEDPSAGIVNTPGTNTAHLLVQLRRGYLEHTPGTNTANLLVQLRRGYLEQRQQQQQQQRGSGSTSTKKAATQAATKAAATVTATVADVADQAPENAARVRVVGRKRKLALQVVGSGTAGAGPVLAERDINSANANLRRPAKLVSFQRSVEVCNSLCRGVVG